MEKQITAEELKEMIDKAEEDFSVEIIFGEAREDESGQTDEIDRE